MSKPAKLLGDAQALHERGQLSDAKKLYTKILRQEKSNTAALFQLATLEAQEGHFDSALELIDRAHKTAPTSADILALKGRILNALMRNDEALPCYERALQINPSHPAALLNLGCTFLLLNRSQEALGVFNTLVRVLPKEPLAHHNRAIALTDLAQYDAAITSADEAIKLFPNYAEALQARGIAYGYKQQHDAALKDFKSAARINPNLDYLIGNLVNAQLWSCDWEDLSQKQQALVAGLKAGRRVATPFSFISMSSSPEEQFACAKIYAASIPVAAKATYQYSHTQFRVAYLSADFREHPTSYLMAGVFEHHDRARFETTAISFAPDNPSAMLTRLTTAFDRFVNVNTQNDANVATLLRKLEIDIAVDLMGYTGGARTGILAQRPCPIQVGYLAYPGTMAANYIDYLIADPTLIPESLQKFYAEKVVYLPDTYAPTDSKRVISDRAFDRADMNLPQGSFVFCCFNNSYKINSRIFDCWMGILKKVEGSVLWLSENNPTAAANLKKEANRRGVSPDRIIFAKRVPLVADHLVRYRLADLFLDTLPNNAHTTANDALWAGLPVLTQIGETFAGRVAASLLTAIGLPELITTTTEAYESLAIELANNPARMSKLRQKLTDNRLTTPLFNTAIYTKHLEAAYTAMHDRYRAGLPPDHIYVSR